MRRRDLLGILGSAAGTEMLGCTPHRAPPGRRVASLWFTYGGRNREVLESLVREFNESQDEHFVHAVFQGDYFEGLAKLRTAMAAKAGPSFSHVIGEVIPYLERAGVLDSFDAYPGADTLDVIAELGQEKSWVRGGEQPWVCLPFNRSTPIAYLNGAQLEKAGLTPPTTWAELREVARAVGYGVPLDWWFWVALTGQAGGEVVEKDGTVSLGGEAGVRAVEFWQTLMHDDHALEPPVGKDYNAWQATNQEFLAGRIGMIWTSTAFLSYLEDNASFPVVAAPLPGDVRRAVPTGGTHWIVPKAAPEEEKLSAWAFLKWMHEAGPVIRWSTSTGYLPVTRSAVQRLERDGYYVAHPNHRVAYEQLSVALPWPWSPDLFRIQREVVQPRLEKAVLRRLDARSVLDEARREATRTFRRAP